MPGALLNKKEAEIDQDRNSCAWQHAQSLLVKGQQSDASAYGAALTILEKKIRIYVQYKLFNAQDAQDIVQDVLVSIHRNLHTYHPDRPLKSWVLAIALNKVRDHGRRFKRKESKQIEFQEEKAGGQEGFVGDEQLDSDVVATMHEALSTLDPKLREPIVAIKLEGLTVAETAKRLGLSESAVKMRCSRGYKILRKKIERVSHEL